VAIYWPTTEFPIMTTGIHVKQDAYFLIICSLRDKPKIFNDYERRLKMKFNFKKITSVLASAVMVGSTIGIAAAANYPAPFIQGGAADVTVVVGAASPSGVDLIAAADVGTSLSSELAKQSAAASSTTASTTSGGDSVKIDKPTNHLNLNDAVTDIWTTSKLTSSDLKELLKDGTYRSKDNIDYSYEQ